MALTRSDRTGTTTTTRSRRVLMALGGTLAAVALVTGCSGGSTAGSALPADAVAPVEPAPEAGGAAGREAPEAAVADTSAGQPAGPTILDAERDLIVTATTTVRTEDVLASTAKALDIARGYDAVVVSQRTTASGEPSPEPYPMDGDIAPAPTMSGYASSTITMRVAPSSVDALLVDLAALGTPVGVTRDVSDVTAEVADVDARVQTARASLDRIRILLAKAEDISDIVALEAELSTRQANLESLLAQQRALADATAMATVTAILVDQETPEPVEPATGFLAGLERGWEALVDALVVGMTIVGAFLPFLILLLIVVVPAVLLIRWAVRRKPAAVVPAGPMGPGGPGGPGGPAGPAGPAGPTETPQAAPQPSTHD